MDKYIIDGVEYSYGEEVEVRDYNNENWVPDYIIGVNSDSNHRFICKTEKWKQIRKLQPKNTFGAGTTTILSGRKAKLTLDDGTEYSVVVE